MTKYRLIVSMVLMVPCTFFFMAALGQYGIIRLYPGKAPGSEYWKQQEAVFYDSLGTKEQFIYNVTSPTLTVFTPDNANGTAVIICPGGAFHVLGIDNEGYHVARWLNSIGITAFVLKYRLAETKSNNPLKELGEKMNNFPQLNKENASIVPLAISDAHTAIRYIRQHAVALKIDPARIGIIGFSAGGTVTAGVALEDNAGSRPNFVASLYSYLPALHPLSVPADAPPLFIAACTDDQLGFAPYSTQLYNLWLAKKRSAEIHIFSAGGHGFGMKIQHLPVDQWRWLFRDWLKAHQFL